MNLPATSGPTAQHEFERPDESEPVRVFSQLPLLGQAAAVAQMAVPPIPSSVITDPVQDVRA
jgi:hypothetical protein